MNAPIRQGGSCFVGVVAHGYDRVSGQWMPRMPTTSSQSSTASRILPRSRPALLRWPDRDYSAADPANPRSGCVPRSQPTRPTRCPTAAPAPAPGWHSASPCQSCLPTAPRFLPSAAESPWPTSTPPLPQNGSGSKRRALAPAEGGGQYPLVQAVGPTQAEPGTARHGRGRHNPGPQDTAVGQPAHPQIAECAGTR